MHVFWKNGYANTSARILEREMNINLFSIYSSFQNKNGVYLESLRAYKILNRKLLLESLRKGSSTLDIKQYSLDFLEFTKKKGTYQGCLLINSAQEFGPGMDQGIKSEIDSFAGEIMSIFESIIAKEMEPSDVVKKRANHLFASLIGLITTAKSLTKEQIDDYLEITFSGY